MWFLLFLLSFLTMFQCVQNTELSDNICVTLSNLSVSLNDTVQFYHCKLENLYVNHIRYRILAEFQLDEPPGNVSFSSLGFAQNLTSAWDDFSQNGSNSEMLAPALAGFGDIAFRIAAQHLNETSSANIRVMPVSHRVRFEKKFLLPTDATKYGLPPDHFRTYFQLQNMTGYKVVNATLYFYVERPEKHRETAADYKYKVHIYKYTKKSELNDIDPYIESHQNLPGAGKWDSVNLTSLVAQWIAAPWKNFGLMLRAEHVGSSGGKTFREELRVGRHNHQRNNTDIFLEIEVKSETSQPQTKPLNAPLANDCSLEPHQYKNYCCRFPLKVDFESFGWDWIVVPKRYDAYYCAGGCAAPSTLQEPHTVITDNQQKIEKHRVGVGPCCAPQDMQAMTVVFIDHKGNVRKRNIPDMIVHRCGCK